MRVLAALLAAGILWAAGESWVGRQFPPVAGVADRLGSRRTLVLFSAEASQVELEKLETAVLRLPAGSEAARALGLRGPAAVLVDRDGVIRRIEQDPKDPVTMVRRWTRGQWIYHSQCARCHGRDGNDTGYAPNIKKIGGIGRRMTEAQILEATAATGVVSLETLSGEERASLAIYVAGL